MAKFITTSFILVLLIVAMMNGHSAEGAGNGNKLEKDDRIYKFDKFGPPLDCLILYNKCIFFHILCPLYYQFCTSSNSADHTLKAEILP